MPELRFFAVRFLDNDAGFEVLYDDNDLDHARLQEILYEYERLKEEDGEGD